MIQACIELAALCLLVIVVLGVLHVPFPAMRHLFWLVVLIKPLVSLAVLAGHGIDGLDRSAWILLTLWGAVAAALLGRVVVGTVYMWRIRRAAEVQLSGPLATAMSSARARMGIRRQVPLAISHAVTSPLLSGIIRPMVLLPRHLTETLTAVQLEDLLLHELAHLRRLDNLTLLLQHLVQCLAFFHPAIWICSRMLRREAELACDEAVIACNGDPVRYADALVRVAEFIQPNGGRNPMTAIAVTQSDLSLRVRRLLGGGFGALSRPARALSITTVAIVALVGLYPTQGWAQDAEVEPTPVGAPVTSARERQALERDLEEKVQSMLDEVIGSGRSVVRISAELQPATHAQQDQAIARLSIALTVDATKIVIDPETHRIYEDVREADEIQEYMHLVQAAAGFNADRGDKITVRALSFDKTQAIQAREQAVSDERRIFWTRMLGWITLAAGLILFSLWMRRSSGPGVFANDTLTRAALALSLGLFFCLLAVDFWDDGLSLQAVSSIPGVFLLIVGAGRLSGHLLPGARDT